MAVLSDRDLSDLYPHYRGNIGPASIDLAIGGTLLEWPRKIMRDPRVDQSALWKTVPLKPVLDAEGEPVDAPCWVLKPGARYLATTRDPIRIPNDLAGQIGARSSWARDGLSVIQGPAGWCDPGYEGRPTLELSVVGSELVLWPGAVICQLILLELTTPCLSPYRGKYQSDLSPTPSRLHLEHVRAEASA